jgi:5'-nucleotidase
MSNRFRGGGVADRKLERVRVLLTNDDGIDAEGLQRLRRELLATPGVELAVVAPDGNRSAIGRGITTRRALAVERLDFGDGTCGYATDGTPVDCVRLAASGIVDDGWTPEVVVAGINHGANLGDDITYSGTVAAALEGLLLGLPAIAVSQQSENREMDFRLGDHFIFDAAARFTARIVEELSDVPLPPSTMLNINVPAGVPHGVEVARLGRRIYRDQLQAHDDGAVDGSGSTRRTYFIYGTEPGYEDEPGTDLVAVASGHVAVTPVHLDLTYHDGIGPLSLADLERLLAPAAHEVE